MKIIRVLLVLLTIVGSVLLVTLFTSCDEGEGPTRNPECGSQVVDWDSKAMVCRDRVNGTVVPNFCCGR